VNRCERPPLGGTDARVTADGKHRFWDETFDVVVVGFGSAGASAAIEASRAGASVLVVDRFAGGGATRLSGGVVYAGGGTDLQRHAGYEDTPEEMAKYLELETRGEVSPEVLRAFCERSRENFEWLRALGAPFPPGGAPTKTSYPLDDCTLYFSGNETAAPYRYVARPAPRGHRTLGKGLSGGNLFAALEKAAESCVTVRRRCRAERLVLDRQNAVVGVELSELVGTTARALHAVGFAADIRSKNSTEAAELLSEVMPEDLLSYGLIPEFIGRLPVVSAVHQLQREDLVQILTEPKNALTKQYQRFFGYDNIELVFTEDALWEISDKALARETGARGLRSIIEAALLDVMFELPSRNDVVKCAITKETIARELKPTLVTSGAAADDEPEELAEESA